MDETRESLTDLEKLCSARHHDPFSFLGPHQINGETVIRAYLPGACSVTLLDNEQHMSRIDSSDLFQWRGQASISKPYQLLWYDANRSRHVLHDPYSFPPQIPDFDLHLFAQGKHWHAYRFLGAHAHEAQGIAGVLFAVWAPNAERVSVVGDFNHWDGRRHPLRCRGGSGVWELFVPDLAPGSLYKYEIRNRHTGAVFLKTDPYAQQFELRPSNAAIVPQVQAYSWQDDLWLQQRESFDWQHRPVSIYEVHLGSWKCNSDGSGMNYRQLAHQLVAHVKALGFTHIELLPLTEFPFDPSWGYQAIGYYAPTSRYGSPDEFRYFVDYCHQNDIGVFLDWVPAHFPKDDFALARFDGSALYEHEDPRLGEHLDWSTLIYNFSRNEVKNFLLSSALFWLEEFHLDGLRVDAVASMLYLDYSREDWLPNAYGGRENLAAIEFIQQLNTVVHQACKGVLMMAEESTSWPQVSRPVFAGGLGFDLKWNMGWMNDTLAYMENDPLHRKHHHNELTFSMLYAFTENFLLPFSHDEVVHGKQSLLNKMPGDEWQKFANLRLLYTYMFTHPGKKLLFMGCEFGQGLEWDSGRFLDWYVLEYPLHQGVQNLVKDLNHLYQAQAPLHTYEFDWQGFEWIDCQNSEQSVISYIRRDQNTCIIVIINFTPVVRQAYRLGVPEPGMYQELFNSDSQYYGGSNMGNGSLGLHSEDIGWMGRSWSINITLPPLAGVVLKRMSD
ncbi:MAG: 1,4-alpha-glucan branching protein GlgB [Gammaproteobacteria bacterium]|nr:1,4-alpha-glucan branching protein GlgB [Gammaproteobacteria bacterium]MDH5802284.1 1,4-alpha-glucan branching protein GlgB [Gammaproteobacteria bacterium]